jgi:hypothetical protein
MTDKDVKGRIILGSGRSGTTWVLDSLAEANELRPVFEPLHEKESELGKRFAYGLMEPGDCDEALERYFMDLSEGKIHSRWIDYRGRTSLLFPNPSRLLTFRGRRSWRFVWRKYLRDRPALRAAARRPVTLIKCIRANLMMGWFEQDLGFRTVLIVRHPCAAVWSQYGNNSKWDPAWALERYQSNRRLHELTDGRYLPILSSKLTKLQAHTLSWVIENQLPVERASEQGHEIVCYEHLLSNPSVAWQAVCKALDLPNVPDTRLLSKPSQQTYIDAGKVREDKREARWRKSLTRQQLAEIQGILDAGGFNFYNVSSEEPTLTC